MTICQLIEKELLELFPSILNNGKVDLTTDDILNLPNSDLFEELNQIKGTPNLDEEEYAELYNLLILLDQCESENEDIDLEKEFGRFIEKYPDTLLFTYLRIHYTTSSIITGDFQGDYVSFYKSLFKNHPEFFNNTISDFLERSNLIESILLINKPPIALLNLIEDATKRHSLSNLKFLLGQIFYQKKAYQRALLQFYHFTGQVESELPHDNYTQEQYHIAISNISYITFYHIKDYENASLYAEVCLSEYEKNGEDIYSFQYLFFEPILIRLRLCISNMEYDEFMQNYKLFRSKIDDDDFDALDIDDIKEFANELKM